MLQEIVLFCLSYSFILLNLLHWPVLSTILNQSNIHYISCNCNDPKIYIRSLFSHYFNLWIFIKFSRRPIPLGMCNLSLSYILACPRIPIYTYYTSIIINYTLTTFKAILIWMISYLHCGTSNPVLGTQSVQLSFFWFLFQRTQSLKNLTNVNIIQHMFFL